MSQEKKLCRYCNTPLPDDKHGNSYYCNETCYTVQKLLRNYKNYRELKSATEPFAIADSLLKMFYEVYSSVNYIPAILLDKAGMKWNIMKAEVTIEEMPVKVINEYGYCLFKNETLRIWKISNQ